MSRKKTHEEYDKQLFEKEIDCFPVEEYLGDAIPILHECLEGHQWKARPTNILNGTKCPFCYQKTRFKTHNQYIEEITIDAIPIEEYKGIKTKILHKCSNNHQWSARPDLILAGHGCLTCYARSKSLTHEDYLSKIKSDVIPLEEYVNQTTKILHICSSGHEWFTQPRSVLMGHGCPKCNLVGGYNKTRFLRDRELALSPGILYSIVLVNKNTYERACVKIGITRGTSNKDVLKRTKGFKGYEPRIQKLCYGTLEDVFRLEQELHKKFAKYKYTEGHHFGGWTETFQLSILPQILKSIPDHPEPSKN